MNPRKKAYEIIYKFIKKEDIYLKEELNGVLPLFSKREDRALITHIVYGVVRYLGKLKWIVSKLLDGKKTSRRIEVLLWMGIYSFLEFDRIPHYATVYEVVDIAKEVEKGNAYKFVNAILRKYLKMKDKLIIPPDPSIKYSYPKWFVKRWKNRLPDEYITFLDANNKIPPETIRVNTLKISREKLKEYLLKEGIEKIEDGYWDDALRIYGYPYIEDIPSYKKGYFTVQDEGAMWVSRILAPSPGETVLDLCSSPGGKAFHMAALMENRGRIYAVDIKDGSLIREGVERLGIDIIETVETDLNLPIEKFYNLGDRVLLDAPCTSLGTIRRRPELKWKKTEKDISRLGKLQRRLLDNASLYVKPGGVLVYSVCSLEKEETEDVIESFLKTHTNYSLSPSDKENPIYLYPHKYDTDGFFIARLKRA